MNSDQQQLKKVGMTGCKRSLKEKLRAGIVTELAEIHHKSESQLLEILSEPTGITSSGYPFISNRAFRLFLQEVPHLFEDGHNTLLWLNCTERLTGRINIFTPDERSSLERSFRVLRNIVASASVTAPSDLWVLSYVLSGLKQAGVLDYLHHQGPADTGFLAKKFSLSLNQLQTDTDLLYSRGLLLKSEENRYSVSGLPQISGIMRLPVLTEDEVQADLVKSMVSIFSGKELDQGEMSLVTALYTAPLPGECVERETWVPTAREIRISWLLLPVVLAFRVLEWASKVRHADNLTRLIPEEARWLLPLLRHAGVADKGDRLTKYGERMINRGPGPFGIIHAYLPYMRAHRDTLSGKAQTHWVVRGENVAASQDANSKTFRAANHALDQFCLGFNFKFNVFIEHAVGCGEATRQRYESSGSGDIQYFGADLEDEAINAAKEARSRGELPSNMLFIRNADIGDPSKVTEGVRAAGFDPEGSVMMVGNGFHEIRNQTNEGMISVFRQYNEAGIVLIFTEESGLSDEDLLTTGWNTYHAGFRYVHQISGQGLRPAIDKGGSSVYSWHKCASLGGYYLMEAFTSKTRSIYPYPGKGGYNPSISVSYFCVPSAVAGRLGCS